MDYQPDIYFTNPDNSCRFVLGCSGSRPLVVLGLNPSTADDQQADQTIKKVRGFAARNGYDGFIMLNIWPERTPYPDQLSRHYLADLHQQNLRVIKNQLQNLESVVVLAAWGHPIEQRPYLKPCLSEIAEALGLLRVRWVQLGELTKRGHPRHPSRAPYVLRLTPFDCTAYLNR